MRTESAPTIALHTANPADRIALRGVRLRARLAGMSQKTTIEQTFVNLEDYAIEAVYTFPLPEGAAVCGFEVVTADRVLTGAIQEAEKAIEQYEQAVSEGHGAFMVEQERPDVFTVRVGNLKPRQAATIRLTYVCPLERADKSIRVAFPTTVAPRYVTAAGTDPLEAMIDGEAVNPPHVPHVPYGLSLEVDVDLGRPLRGVYSPSHSIRVDRQGENFQRATVTLAGGVTEMNRDIVLTIDLPAEHEPAVQSERGKGGETYLAVTFVPEFDEDELVQPPPAETVFVLDCSGSMQGDSINQAVAALELCLRSLSPGDTFNVCRFGSGFELMASEPVPYSDKTLNQALAYVRRGADLGGTELYAPLEAILKTPPRAGTVRQVILLTDGEVTNERAVIDLARQHRRYNRVFTFGIGAASSAYLVKGIARATGGASEFITAGERIDEKVLRTFGRLASPMVSDVSIDWDGAEVQTLAELPPVFDGDVLSVFGRAPGDLPSRVTLTCRTAGGLMHWSVAVPPPLPVADAAAPRDSFGPVATMWARRMIQSLEEVNDINRARSTKDIPREQQAKRQTLIDLSQEFGLLCSLTTFIAVEHRSVEERNNGRPALRRVPVALAKGWGGVELRRAYAGAAVVACMSPPNLYGPETTMAYRSRSFDARGRADAKKRRGVLGSLKDSLKKAMGATPPAAALPPPPPRPSKSARGKARPTGLPLDDVDKSVLTSEERAYNARAAEAAAGPAQPPSPADDLRHLLSLQSADGRFAWDDQAARLVAEADGANRWRGEIESGLPTLADSVSREEVVQAVLVMLLLTTRFADQEPLWRRAYRKAVRSYLAPAIGLGPTEAEAWLQQLRDRIAAPA